MRVSKAIRVLGLTVAAVISIEVPAGAYIDLGGGYIELEYGDSYGSIGAAYDVNYYNLGYYNGVDPDSVVVHPGDVIQIGYTSADDYYYGYDYGDEYGYYDSGYDYGDEYGYYDSGYDYGDEYGYYDSGYDYGDEYGYYDCDYDYGDEYGYYDCGYDYGDEYGYECSYDYGDEYSYECSYDYGDEYGYECNYDYGYDYEYDYSCDYGDDYSYDYSYDYGYDYTYDHNNGYENGYVTAPDGNNGYEYSYDFGYGYDETAYEYGYYQDYADGHSGTITSYDFTYPEPVLEMYETAAQTIAEPVAATMEYNNEVGSASYNIGYYGDAATNVSRACELNNDIIIPAGGTYRASDYIGSGSYDMGFVDAPGLMSDGSTPLMPGSGICPVTTYIYQAGKDAGLTIVEHNDHSGAACSYAEAGEQAMYNYGSSDLVMVNPYDYDIKLNCSYEGGTLSAGFYK